MEGHMILFSREGLVQRKGATTAVQKFTGSDNSPWSHIISDLLLQPIENEDFCVEIGPKGQTKGNLLYVTLKDSVELSQDFECLDLRQLESLGKDNQNNVRKYIEWGIANHTLPHWLHEIKLLYFSGNTPYYTPRQLAYFEEAASRKAMEDKISNKSLALSVCVPLCLGILMDYFFFDHRFGISVVLFLVTLSGIVLVKGDKLHVNVLSVALGAGAFILSLSFALFNNETLRGFNTLLLPFATTGFFLTLLYKDAGLISMDFFGTILGTVLGKPLLALGKIAIPFKRLFSFKKIKLNTNVLQISLGVVLAVPVLWIILSLLAGSDQVFNKVLANMFRFRWFLNWNTLVDHFIIVGIVTVYFFGYLWNMRFMPTEFKAPKVPKRWMETVTIMTFLGLILAVYTAFAYIQVRYLFLQGALPEGFIHATYARKGFFELVAVTCFNVLILTTVHRWANYGGEKVTNLVKFLMTALVGFSFMLLYTGFYRMFLYESAFGYTELRLFVLVFMAFMGLSLIGVLMWIWNENVPLLKSVFVLSIVFYCALNMVNIDATIAGKNIHHPVASVNLDTYFLSQLSVDAYPVIRDSLKDHPNYAVLIRHFKQHNEYAVSRSNQWYTYNLRLQLYKDSTR